MSLQRGLREALPALRTSADDADRVAYGRDLWPRHHFEVRAGRPAENKPEAIAWPTSTEELAHLVRWAGREGVPLVAFGGGSGVCGGVLPRADSLVVDLKRMDRIRAIDAHAPLVAVEAGQFGVPLERALNRTGLTLGHFPSSILCSTVGGWIATRSAGQCSGAYGKIEDMVVALECVTGAGEIVELRRRATGPDLVPLLVGSEGTLAVIASAELRLHPAPTSRGFGAWSFPTTEHGWDAMRALFQAGLRPAVARLYDPFDAMMAKRGGVKPANVVSREPAPGRGGAVLRAILKRPAVLNELLSSTSAGRALGGSMLVVVFEQAGDSRYGRADRGSVEEARPIVEALRGRWEGEAPAERWLQHRYAVSYRQAPVFAHGAFVDTFEVAAKWSKLGSLYDAVRRALGAHVFVMAHFSHAYPDGCCVYFSFAGSARAKDARNANWDDACEAVYDRTWRAALKAAVDAGGTLAHHHGVGRSKAPRLADELGTGIEVVRALMRGFDPQGILNPGNLLPPRGADARSTATASGAAGVSEIRIDRTSLLVCADGATRLAVLEERLNKERLTLDANLGSQSSATTVADWLARGAPGTRDRWRDPVDQLVAGFDATLVGGQPLYVRAAPRRAVGPDLAALLVGAGGRFGHIDRAWLRVHPIGTRRPTCTAFEQDREPPVGSGEQSLLDTIARTLQARD